MDTRYIQTFHDSTFRAWKITKGVFKELFLLKIEADVKMHQQTPRAYVLPLDNTTRLCHMIRCLEFHITYFYVHLKIRHNTQIFVSVSNVCYKRTFLWHMIQFLII